MTQQPSYTQQPRYSQQSWGPLPLQQQSTVGPFPPPKRRKPAWFGFLVGAVALVLLVQVALLARWIFQPDDAADESTNYGGSGKTIQPGDPVNDQTLSEVDPLAFHESVIKRQMVAPIGRLKAATFSDRQDFTRNGSWSIRDAAIDHQTERFYYFHSYLEGPEDEEPFNTTCVGGMPYSWHDMNGEWKPVQGGMDPCTKASYGGADSIAASGLTAEQADQVIAALRSNKGYVNPEQPTLLKVGGKTYVRQVVDLKPIVLVDDAYWGSAISMWAFRDAGLDPVTWPWTNPHALVAGIHAVYYLDTSTLMPVAAYQEAIDAPRSPNGAPGSRQETIQVINYSFPETLPADPELGDDPMTLEIMLPEGWKPQ